MKVLQFVLYFLLLLIVTSCQNAEKDKNYQELKIMIEDGLDKEQAIRKQISLLDSFDIELNNKMGAIDSFNLVNVLKFLDTYQYPSISKDGKKLCDGVFYILQHGDEATMEKYVDQLKDLAFAGEASKKHYALMTDRILVSKNQKQIYGTQAMPRKNAAGYITNDYFIWPIEDVVNINNLRKEMGFATTIEQYAIDMGAEFNKDEMLKE